MSPRAPSSRQVALPFSDGSQRPAIRRRQPKFASSFEASNEYAATVILSDIGRAGGAEALPTKWALLFRARHPRVAAVECGSLVDARVGRDLEENFLSCHKGPIE